MKKIIKGSKKVNLILTRGTKLVTDEASYCSNSQRNLLRFKDIRQNDYHIEITNDENNEYL